MFAEKKIELQSFDTINFLPIKNSKEFQMRKEKCFKEFIQNYLKHRSAIQWASIIVSIVRWERAIVWSVPWIVQRIAGVAFVAINFEFIVIGLRIDFEMWILSISANGKIETKLKSIDALKTLFAHAFILNKLVVDEFLFFRCGFVYFGIYLPFIAFEIFKFDTQWVIFVVGEHVDIFVAQPKFLGRITEAIFIVGPVAIEVFARFTKVVTPLNYLSYLFEMKTKQKKNTIYMWIQTLYKIKET